jgi:hypothetical protein
MAFLLNPKTAVYAPMIMEIVETLPPQFVKEWSPGKFEARLGSYVLRWEASKERAAVIRLPKWQLVFIGYVNGLEDVAGFEEWEIREIKNTLAELLERDRLARSIAAAIGCSDVGDLSALKPYEVREMEQIAANPALQSGLASQKPKTLREALAGIQGIRFASPAQVQRSAAGSACSARAQEYTR